MKTITLTTPAKETSECFVGKNWGYRDSDFDNWLPMFQPSQESTVSVVKLERAMTFREMAKEYLGSDDIEVIKKHTLTLPMFEELVKNAEENGFETSGCGNFGFVENADGSVSVACVRRGGPRWHSVVVRLDHGYAFDAGRRLLVCNLDTKTLKPLAPVSDLESRIEKIEQILANHKLV